jgi:excinuclease ABC subunit A
MPTTSTRSAIRLRGARHNNLKNFDLDLPLNKLIVITGLSGSGKSSLAFDTLFAEGQRRYIETFSPYARQFFDRMDRPRVDSIEGIPPAIAIEQRNAVRTTRSTVGTMTEICDYMKMLWPHIAQLHCRQCWQRIRKESPRWIWEAIQAGDPPGSGAEDPRREVLITFTVPLTEKLALEESLELVAKQGYQRLLLEGQVVRLEEAARPAPGRPAPVASLTVVQDRLRPAPGNRARFVEACEQAYHFGKGKLTVWELAPASGDGTPGPARQFSDRLHCATCDIEYREPSTALFSFNHPVGACPACRGFGRVISIDYNLALPDRSRTLASGVVKPWQTGHGAESQGDLLRVCRRFGIPTDVPFEDLPKQWQDFVIEGEPGYGKDPAHEWPRAWYGVKGYFRWLESKAYKMHVRVLLSRYRAYTPCPDCQGKRFQPEALLYRVRSAECGMRNAKNGGRRSKDEAISPSTLDPRHSERKSEVRSAKCEARDGADVSLSLADFYQLPIRDALRFIERIGREHRVRAGDPLGLVLGEVRSRLEYLHQVGLGYLTLDRPTRSLSGGETERVNLTTCLGTRLVNTLFVLDEPSVGLHSRDTERLVRILQQLRDAGNTVVVVEHEASVMRAADQIVDLGPGHGASGGQVVFQGAFREILKSTASLTGQYLSGRRRVEIPARRPVEPEGPKSEVRRSKVEGLSPEGGRGECEPLMLQEAARPFGVRAGACPVLKLSHATRHNLKDLALGIPLNRFVCVTGVSGSGKTTLVREVLLPALTARLKGERSESKASDRFGQESNGEADNPDSTPGASPATLLDGAGALGGVVLVDQSILGKTPRSNPAVYIGAFDDIREVFAQSDAARQRGLNASAFSFNSAQGQCQRCRGAGFEKIEMQFLSDVFIRCPDCNGRRYRAHILEVRLKAEERRAKSEERKGKSGEGRAKREEGMAEPIRGATMSVQGGLSTLPARNTSSAVRAFSIADLLEATVEEAVDFLSAFPESRPAQRAVRSLQLLEEVGLGYVKLGQPINTLSGGESQRLKLVRHLAEVDGGSRTAARMPEPCGALLADGTCGCAQAQSNQPTCCKPILFLFDEPTTGLHFDDVRLLLRVFNRLVDAGHSVVVIEHNLDVIKSADWLIDLGPEAGDEGGRIVAEGTPEEVAACPGSHTGKALREAV